MQYILNKPADDTGLTPCRLALDQPCNKQTSYFFQKKNKIGFIPLALLPHISHCTPPSLGAMQSQKQVCLYGCPSVLELFDPTQLLLIRSDSKPKNLYIHSTDNSYEDSLTSCKSVIAGSPYRYRYSMYRWLGRQFFIPLVLYPLLHIPAVYCICLT